MNNISYELAKRLKEAGFPQDNSQWILYTLDTPSIEVSQKDYYALRSSDLGKLPVGQILAAPTLSELIEWCGDEFASLCQGFAFQEKPEDGKIWFCKHRFWSSLDPDEVNKNIKFYSSPEEAVAELGIAMHKVLSPTML